MLSNTPSWIMLKKKVMLISICLVKQYCTEAIRTSTSGSVLPLVEEEEESDASSPPPLLLQHNL